MDMFPLPPSPDLSRDVPLPTDRSREADRNLGGRWLRGSDGHSLLLLCRSASRSDSRACRRDDFVDFGLLAGLSPAAREAGVLEGPEGLLLLAAGLSRAVDGRALAGPLLVEELGRGKAVEDIPAISSIISSGSPTPPEVLEI